MQQNCTGDVSFDSQCLSEYDPTGVYTWPFFYPFPAQYTCLDQAAACAPYVRRTGAELPSYDNFSSYTYGEVIGMDNSNYEVTAGSANFVSFKTGCSAHGGVPPCAYNWGHVQAPTFRLWLGDRYDASRAQYTDFSFEFAFYVSAFIDNSGNDVTHLVGEEAFGTSALVDPATGESRPMRQTPRVSIEGRYQGGGSGSYYFNFMHDGKILMLRRCCGMFYRRIADVSNATWKYWDGGAMPLNQKNRLRVSLNGGTFRMFFNNQPLYQGEDRSFSWGAIGVRMDMIDAYITDLRVSPALAA